MSWRRLAVAIQVWVGLAVVALLYYQIFLPKLAPMTESGGDFQGPFSSVLTNLEHVVPIVCIVIGVGVLLWTIVGAVQEERARQRRVVR